MIGVGSLLTLAFTFASAFVLGILIPLVFPEQFESPAPGAAFDPTPAISAAIALVANYPASIWPGAGERHVAVCLSGGNMQVFQETELSFRTYLVEAVGADVFVVGTANDRMHGLAALGSTLVASVEGPTEGTDNERRIQCLQLIRTQEKARGTLYEYVIFTRPDFRYVLPHPTLDRLNHNNTQTMYTIHNRQYGPKPLEVIDKHFVFPRKIADAYIVSLRNMQPGDDASIVSRFVHSAGIDHLVLPSPFYLSCISGTSSTCRTDHLSNTLSEPLTYEATTNDMHELFGLRHNLKFLSSQGIRMGDMDIQPFKDLSDSKMWG
jgi:hypothetical protein